MEGITHVDLKGAESLVAIGYCIWAIAQFFDGKKPGSYIKSFFAYLLGMVTYVAFTKIIGALVDMVIK